MPPSMVILLIEIGVTVVVIHVSVTVEDRPLEDVSDREGDTDDEDEGGGGGGFELGRT